MFETRLGCPIAVASPDDDGVDAGIEWCLEHLGDDQTLTVWTHLMSNLAHNDRLAQLTRHSNVEHVTGRGGWHMRFASPLLMAWPDLEGLGDANRQARRVTALCVISWNEDELADWVNLVNLVNLGDGSSWGQPPAELDSLIVEELTHVSGAINHNNTIAAGYEKDHVVGRCELSTTRASRCGLERSRRGRWRTGGRATTRSALPGTSPNSTLGADRADDRSTPPSTPAI